MHFFFQISLTPSNLRQATELRLELYARYEQIDQRIGHTLSPSGIALPELRGVSLADNHDDTTGRTLSAGADVSTSVLRDRCLPCQCTLAFPIPTRPGTNYRNQLNYGVLRYAP